MTKATDEMIARIAWLEWDEKVAVFESLFGYMGEEFIFDYLLRSSRPSPESRYCIRGCYRHREKARYFDDTQLTDEYQKEVYEAVADIMRSEGLHAVYDVGCGSGYKLLRYLGNFDTVGFDVEPTLSFLKSKYPEREWKAVSFDDRTLPAVDIIVCADVVEHVENPDALLAFLDRIVGRFLVISTPDRDLMYNSGDNGHCGPPRNPCHLREWSFSEFEQYIGSYFDIIEHRISK